MSKVKRIFWRILFWLALIVFLISAGILGFLIYGYWKASSEYEDIADTALMGTEAQLSSMTVDWDYLASINEDVVAWVYVPGTPIDYPVVHSHDNQEYLHRSFGGDDSFSGRGGAIFMDMQCEPDCSSQNTILYGHHMRDGSMFAAVSDDLTKQDLFNEKNTVYVLTPTCNYRCRFFSVIRTTGDEKLAQADFVRRSDETVYVQDKIDRSIVVPQDGFPDASDIDRFFTLSTCDYAQQDGRAVAFARIVETAIPER